MPPIAILWVPTFELAYSSSSGLSFTRVYMWGELCGRAAWGELGGALGGGAVCRSYVGEAVWWDCGWELCGGSCVVGSCLSPVPPGGLHHHLLGGGMASS